MRDKTIKAATHIAAGGTVAAGSGSASAAILAEEVSRAMIAQKLTKWGLAGLLALGVLAGGTAVVKARTGPQDAPKPGTGPADEIKAIAGQAATKPKEEEKDDLERLEGSWTGVFIEAPEPDAAERAKGGFRQKAAFAIQGGILMGHNTGGRLPDHYQAFVDPGRNPSVLELRGRDRVKKTDARWPRMIYKIEGNTLTIALRIDDPTTVPTDFTLRSNPPTVLGVFQKQIPPTFNPKAAETSATKPAAEPPITPDGPARDDLERLQGTWLPTSLIKDGEEASDGPARPEPLKTSLTVMGARLFSRSANGTIADLGRIRLDASKSPKVMETTDGEFRPGVSRAIYKIDGDTLTLCMDTSDPSRAPSEFSSLPNSNRVLIVCRRASPPTPPPAVGLDELKLLQGDWLPTSILKEGRDITEVPSQESGVTKEGILIRGDRFIRRAEGAPWTPGRSSSMSRSRPGFWTWSENWRAASGSTTGWPTSSKGIR